MKKRTMIQSRGELFRHLEGFAYDNDVEVHGFFTNGYFCYEINDWEAQKTKRGKFAVGKMIDDQIFFKMSDIIKTRFQ